MNIDRRLLRIATKLLRDQDMFPESHVCAAYLSGGKVAVAFSSKAALAPELEVIAEAQTRGSQIAAIVTVCWASSGSKIVVRRPAIAITDKLVGHCRRHAPVGIAGDAERDDVEAQPLWRLMEENDKRYVNDALQQGRYGTGMKAIAGDLRKISLDTGVPHAHGEFGRSLLTCLQLPEVIGAARSIGTRTAQPTPEQLESISLRHVWLALEEAIERFGTSLLDTVSSDLLALECNQADRVHIKQGFEAFRNVAAVLVVFIGTRQAPTNECPFYPYDSSLLSSGRPIQQALGLPLRLDQDSDRRHRNTNLVRDLINVLADRGSGGFTGYLRQRRLYSVDMFQGKGAGTCPFSSMSEEMLFATATTLKTSMNHNLILLEP